MSPILIALCLSLTSAPGEEKGIDFPQKSTAPPVAPGIPPTPSLQNRIDFFEKKIRPILSEECYRCHASRSKKLRGGLRVDGREALIEGGDSGPALVPGKPKESLLLRAISYLDNELEMPPSGKLDPQVIADFEHWITIGAPWPGTKATKATKKRPTAGYDWSRFRSEHWSYREVTRPQPPQVRRDAWIRTPVDRFVLAQLESSGLSTAPEANPRILIRRVYFDVIGLPPSPDEVAQFVEDAANEESSGIAFAKVVDRLLSAPQYGERWARHWLDVARYNDGFGMGYDGGDKPQAFRYRDWVVAALNHDLPYDEFIKQQIAGDLLSGPTAATGFLALGPHYRSDGGDPESIAKARADTLEDRLDTTFRGVMGLTIACARCHDHKFDPIPMQDYYSLAGVFNNTKEIEWPLAPADQVKVYDDHEKSIEDARKRLGEARRAARKTKGDPQVEAKEQKEIAGLEAKVNELRESLPPKYPFLHTVADSGATDMHVALRGDLRKHGDLAPRRFLRLLTGEDRPHWQTGSGRRELAGALTGSDNPLTARVFVNRIWMHHFGFGLVRTPSNFGVLGEQPTHPQLLDWLASELIDGGWSIKKIHRAILLSSTYRMSSGFNADNDRRDGENRLLWRMNPRRLEVEAWRDGLMAVTGELTRGLGGPPTDKLLDSDRRTLYSIISRNGDRFASDRFLRLFDFPAARITSEKRAVSTVPQQHLFMLNSPFMLARAKALVRRLAKERDSESARIELAYVLLFTRKPSQEELALGRSFLAEEGKGLPKWEQYAQALLSAQEFLYAH